MKRLNIWLCSMLLCITACEKDLPVFEDPDCLLNFNYGSQLSTEEVTEMMRNGSHSFKLKTPEGQLSDTVWLDVDIMGKLSAEDRPLALQQVMVEGTKNAVAGTHYIAFDDPVLAEFYVVPAHSATAHIPVILKRDPSLAEGNVVLRITFRENANFKTGYPEFSTYTLTVSDRLSRPNAWDLASLDYYFGEYGEKKHEQNNQNSRQYSFYRAFRGGARRVRVRARDLRRRQNGRGGRERSPDHLEAERRGKACR